VMGLVGNFIPKGIAILQYVDDTIMCLDHDVEKARNVKLLLYVFEQLSGMKINFDKNELLLLGEIMILQFPMQRFLTVRLGYSL
jgi:hypothetical protein